MTGREIIRLADKERLGKYSTDFLGGQEYGRWRIEKDFAQFIGLVCETLRPRKVLEFGTGLSTVVLAHEASKGNVGRILSVDHLEDFPGHPRNILKKEGMREAVDFFHFPIRLHYIAGKIFQFYSMPEGFLSGAGELDLVIVDGPPYYYNSREAALYFTFPYLSKDALVLLDDAKRADKEGRYINNWKAYFGEAMDSVTFQDQFKKGLACIWPTGRKENHSSFQFNERFKDSARTFKCEALSIVRKLRGRA